MAQRRAGWWWLPVGVLPAALATVGCPGGAGALEGQEVARTDHFAFHSDSWMNLHHFLYQWSRAEEGLGEGRQAVVVPERGEMSSLDRPEERAWREAVDFYRDRLADRSHFDDDMLEVKARLLGGEGGADVLAAVDSIVPGLGGVLRAAHPVYEARWWGGHDRTNRAWIAETLPLLEAHEAFGIETMERAYAGAWPGRVRVDVSVYGNWAGAYTSNRPPHVVILSGDPRNGGLYAYELMMHEPGHISVFGSTTRNDLREAIRAEGGELTPNLAHAAIFFTAGWTADQVARGAGGRHEAYAVREGIAESERWAASWALLEEHWRPFLDGAISRDEAIARIAAALGADRPPPDRLDSGSVERVVAGHPGGG